MSTQSSHFKFGHDELTVIKALQMASGQLDFELTKAVQQKINQSAKAVSQIVDKGKVVYSINTGFGSLCSTVISKKDTKLLQENILRSHSVGVGTPIAKEIAKLMLVLKIHALSFGYSGIALSTLERIMWHIKKDIIPLVPSQGSVGASGDLAPLAHLFLPLIGLGEVQVGDQVRPAGEVLQEHGLQALTLGPKEGLALINGTQFMLAFASHIVERLYNCLQSASLIGALSVEAMLGSTQPFRNQLHQLRPHPGALFVAHQMSSLLKGSELVESHANCDRVQDPYSLRCIPQVHGASWDAWKHLHNQVRTELNSVTDNPIIFNENDTVSGGHFHGQPLALPMDYAAFAASEIGNISERRTYLMLEGKAGLPLLLMKDTGINSGFMIPQYTAAALVSENKSLCFPASADSIPTSVGQEDHVSMGSISGRKTLQVVMNLEKILAVELLCAAQAFDFRRPLKSGPLLETCHDLVRQRIAHADEDRLFGEDIKVAQEIIASGALCEVVEQEAQKRKIDFDGPHAQEFLL